MNYLLKEISIADQQKIINDADENKRLLLLRRGGGHFENSPGLSWAIDYYRNSYLFWAPRTTMESRKNYYFYIDGRMYALHVDSFSSGVVHFDDCPPTLQSKNLKEAVRSAFLCYGIYGKADDTTFHAKFADEV